MAIQQVGFVVVNGFKYTITLMPAPGQFEQLRPQAEKAWNTITGSIVFFEPSVVPKVIRPDDVCPKATNLSKLYVDLAGGLCALYPATFNINAEFGSSIEGGPVLGDFASRPIRASLNVSHAGGAGGMTPRQLFEPRLVNKVVSKIDDAGAKDATVGGFPAIVWTEGAPVGSRQAIIVAHDQMFTIVNQPYNDPNYPNGAADVDLVWNTVTQSLAFFDIWR
jgi:hypothetical protein